MDKVISNLRSQDVYLKINELGKIGCYIENSRVFQLNSLLSVIAWNLGSSKVILAQNALSACIVVFDYLENHYESCDLFAKNILSILPEVIKFFGRTEEQLRVASGLVLQHIFVLLKSFSKIDSLIMHNLKSSNWRIRAQLLLTVLQCIPKLGADFAVSVVDAFLPQLVAMLNDVMGSVRDASVKLIALLHRYDARVKEHILSSKLPKSLLDSVLQTMSSAEEQLAVEDVTIAQSSALSLTENDLKRQVQKIARELSEDVKRDWEVKSQLLNQLKPLVVRAVELETFNCFEHLRRPLVLLLDDSRLALIEQVVRTLTFISSKFGQFAASLMEHLMPALIKLFNSSNQVLLDVAERCATSILLNSWPNCVPLLVNIISKSKNAQMRSRCIKLISVVVLESPDDYLDSSKTSIISMLKMELSEADVNARSNARKCLKLLSTRLPQFLEDNSNDLLSSLKPSVLATLRKEGIFFDFSSNIVDSLSSTSKTPYTSTSSSIGAQRIVKSISVVPSAPRRVPSSAQRTTVTSTSCGVRSRGAQRIVSALSVTRNIGNVNGIVTNENDNVINDVITDENNVVTEENNIIMNENNVITDENNVITDENNVITDENNVITDENNVIMNENNVIMNENNVITNDDTIIDNIDERLSDILCKCRSSSKDCISFALHELYLHLKNSAESMLNKSRAQQLELIELLAEHMEDVNVAVCSAAIESIQCLIPECIEMLKAHVKVLYAPMMSVAFGDARNDDCRLLALSCLQKSCESGMADVLFHKIASLMEEDAGELHTHLKSLSFVASYLSADESLAAPTKSITSLVVPEASPETLILLRNFLHRLSPLIEFETLVSIIPDRLSHLLPPPSTHIQSNVTPNRRVPVKNNVNQMTSAAELPNSTCRSLPLRIIERSISSPQIEYKKKKFVASAMPPSHLSLNILVNTPFKSSVPLDAPFSQRIDLVEQVGNENDDSCPSDKINNDDSCPSDKNTNDTSDHAKNTTESDLPKSNVHEDVEQLISLLGDFSKELSNQHVEWLKLLKSRFASLSDNQIIQVLKSQPLISTVQYLLGSDSTNSKYIRFNTVSLIVSLMYRLGDEFTPHFEMLPIRQKKLIGASYARHRSTFAAAQR